MPAVKNTAVSFPGKPKAAPSPEDRFRALLTAYDQRQSARDNVALQAEAGSTFSRNRARMELLKAEQLYKDGGIITQKAQVKPAAAPVTKPAAPTVSVDAIAATQPAPVALTDAVPPPTAVTNPASQISPEEEAARLRARLLLTGGAQQRGGALPFSSGGVSGIRSLGGF